MALKHYRVLKRLRHASMATKFSVLNKRTCMQQDGGAVTIASLLSFFENENKSVSRGEYHFKSNNVESFSASQVVFKGQVHASLEKIVYNVTISQ